MASSIGPYASTPAEEKLRELFFFDCSTGSLLARRGMIALSLPVADAELTRWSKSFQLPEKRAGLLADARA